MKKRYNLAEKNGMWKGNKVGIKSLHYWIRRRKPIPKLCEHCKKNKPYDLSNISGKYKRDLNDWKYLCRRCHMKSDNRLKIWNNRNKQFNRHKGRNNPNYKRGNYIKKIC